MNQEYTGDILHLHKRVNYRAVNTYERMKAHFQTFLTAELDGGDEFHDLVIISLGKASRTH